MYKIIRKWKRESDQAPPCCGAYMYQAEYANGVKGQWMTEQRYAKFKGKVIQENWK